jgi:hypothetical protein
MTKNDVTKIIALRVISLVLLSHQEVYMTVHSRCSYGIKCVDSNECLMMFLYLSSQHTDGDNQATQLIIGQLTVSSMQQFTQRLLDLIDEADLCILRQSQPKKPAV